MTDPLHMVDTASCRGDGICVEVCPENTLEIVDGKAATVQSRADDCILCGQCVAVCPNDSLSMPTLPMENFSALTNTPASYDELFALLASRRSVRVFKDAPIEKEKIDLLLDAASTAPMGFPPHSTEVLIISDRNERAFLLEQVVREYTQLGKAMKSGIGRAIVRMAAGKQNYRMLREYILALSIRANEDYNRDGTDRYMYSAPVYMLFHGDSHALSYDENAHIVCTYTMLAAQSCGLGSTVIGLVPPIVDKSKALRTRYGIPDGNRVLTSLAIGYPKYRYRKSIRRELAGVRLV